MKIVYKEDICQQIDVAIFEAKKENRKIDYIELNPVEWIDLKQRAQRMLLDPGPNLNDIEELTYNGVKVRRKGRKRSYRTP